MDYFLWSYWKELKLSGLQAPLPMKFSRQEYWSGVLFSTPGDLPNPGIQPTVLHLLHLQADSVWLWSLSFLMPLFPHLLDEGSRLDDL